MQTRVKSKNDCKTHKVAEKHNNSNDAHNSWARLELNNEEKTKYIEKDCGNQLLANQLWRKQNRMAGGGFWQTYAY